MDLMPVPQSRYTIQIAIINGRRYLGATLQCQALFGRPFYIDIPRKEIYNTVTSVDDDLYTLGPDKWITPRRKRF